MFYYGRSVSDITINLVFSHTVEIRNNRIHRFEIIL